MEQKDLFNIIIPILTEEHTSEEKDAFENWHISSKHNQKLFSSYKRIWEEASYKQEYNQFDKYTAFQKMMNKSGRRIIKREYKQRIIGAISGIAATLILVFGISWMTTFIKDTGDIVKINVPKGDHSQVMLPDGSTIWMNSDSYIEYSTDFGKENRNIHLVGEAFFDVEKQTIPFIVNANEKLDVTVLGTRFNVMAYPNQEMIETTLEEGSISMKLNEKDTKERLLKPGQWGGVNTKTGKYEIKDVNPIIFRDWLDGKIILREESLIQLVRRLERWYDIKIEIDKSLANESLHFNATFENVASEQVIKAIASAGNFTYEISNGIITLKR